MSSTASERLQRVNDLEVPEGAYTVELVDAATGRTVERLEADNYVSPAYERWVRWAQGGGFTDGYQAIGNNTVSTYGAGPLGLGLTDVDWLNPPRLNADAVVLTDSAIAESSTSEWGTGRTIAYGTRWKLTIPAAGKRGQINEAQSTIGDDLVRLVWDFNETQGNGTFQSLNLADVDADGNLTCPLQGYHYRYDNPSGGGDLTIDLQVGGMNSAGTEAYGVAVEPSSGGGVSGDPVALYRIPLTGGTDNGDYYQCSSPVKLCTLASLAYSTSSGAGTLTTVAGSRILGVAPVGADYLIAWPGDDGKLYLARYTAAGARSWAIEVIADLGTTTSQSTAATVATDGTKAYVGQSPTSTWLGQSPEYTEVHRVDLATQTVDATVDLGTKAASTVQLLGSDLLIGCAASLSGTTGDPITDALGIHRISTGGVFQEYLGNPFATTRTDVLVSPWPSGTSTAQSIDLNSERRAGRRTEYAGTANELYNGGWNTAARADHPNTTYGVGPYVGNGKLYRAHYLGSGQHRLWQLGGSNIFSRTVLGAAISKSSSQTMQVTYELTLPASWRGRPTFVAPPS
ncbi:MAG: hypothetical protein ACF8PN_04900 [Phycisphaerales bacterium]